MSRSSRWRLAAALFLSMGLGSCAGFTNLFIRQSGTGLEKVDNLLGRIQAVHIESVICRERVEDALASLENLVRPDFRGDPLEAYALFLDGVERSEQQAEDMDDAVGPMRDAADNVFNTWSDNLEKIDNLTMRRHSQDRLDETRARYDTIVDAVEHARANLDTFNAALRDHLFFLGQDFNAAAVAEIAPGLAGIQAQAKQLDGDFVGCQAAAQAYVTETSLRGQGSAAPGATASRR